MRSLLARLAVLGAFALSLTACSNGSGTSLPFAGGPNNTGGSPGTFQSGSNGLALLRFIHGSPGNGTVDVCVDSQPFGVTNGSASYGTVATGSANNGTLYSVPGGIPHTLSVYPSQGSSMVGVECPTAPGPYFGVSALAVTTLSPGNNVRWTIVLGGAKGSPQFGLYVFAEPTYPISPAGLSVISHNAAPTFSAGPPARGVGFGVCTTTVTPCAANVVLPGAGNIAAPKPSSVAAAVTNGFVQSGINTIPPGFYDGVGVSPANPLPITSVAAPNALANQPYVMNLYAFDGPAGGLNLLAVPETTLGFGF